MLYANFVFIQFQRIILWKISFIMYQRKSCWIIGNIRIVIELWKNCCKTTSILHWYEYNIWSDFRLKASTTSETKSRKVYFILTRERFLFRFFVLNVISQLIIRYLRKLLILNLIKHLLFILTTCCCWKRNLTKIFIISSD